MKPILTQNQIAALKAIGRDQTLAKRFYLTGGTPLAAFYLGHRYSEDLDFFSADEVDLPSLNAFWKKTRPALGISKIDFQQSHNRNLFFLHVGKQVLKTEFTYFPFPRIEAGPTKYGVAVDSLLDIAVNKLFTIYQRTQARDYVDLFVICQERHFTVAELVAKAKIKFDWHVDPIQLGTQFSKAVEAPDFPRLIKKIKPKKWQEFFLAEAKKLRSQVLD